MNYYNFSILMGKIFHVNNYLYAMSLYHLIGVYFFFAGITGFNMQTLVRIDESLIHSSYGLKEVLLSGRSIGGILSLSVILMFIDLIFLMMLSYDFRGLNLTMRKITLIEIVIFIASLFSPELRGTMLFMSFNTIQIFAYFHCALWVKNTFNSNVGGYLIDTGSYILLFKILYFYFSYVLLQ